MPLTRAFLALELDAATRDHLQARVEALPSVRFVARATWHITLAFLGEIDDVGLAAATASAQEVAAQMAPFSLRTAGIGIFGTPDAPKVIWIGVTGDRPALFRLQQLVAQALDRRQIAFDHRFSPHITLARLQQPLTVAEAEGLAGVMGQPIDGPSLAVTHISLMRSDRLPTGAVYINLVRAELTANA